MLYVSNIIDENTIKVSDSRTLKTTVVDVNKLRTEGTKVFGLTQSRVVVYRDVEDFLTRYALRQKLVNHDYEYIFEYADNEIRISSIDIYTTNMIDLEIPDFVDTVGDFAFRDRSNIRSVYIPDSVIRLGEYCFYGCGRLESVRLSQSLTCLAEYVFSECESLRNIALPESITELGTSCFRDCYSLKDINISDTSITELKSGCFRKCRSLKSLELPNSLQKIDECVFRDCDSLEEIRISSLLNTLEDYTFLNCINLRRLVIKGIADNSILGIEAFIRYFKKGVSSIEVIEIDKSVGTSLSSVAEELGIKIRLLEE